MEGLQINRHTNIAIPVYHELSLWTQFVFLKLKTIFFYKLHSQFWPCHPAPRETGAMEFIHNICPLTPLMLHANYGKNWLNSLYEVREKSNVNKQHTHTYRLKQIKVNPLKPQKLRKMFTKKYDLQSVLYLIKCLCHFFCKTTG